MSNCEIFSWGYQEARDWASPEVKEIYGKKFLASSECSVDHGERNQPFSGSLGPPLEPPTVSGPSSGLSYSHGGEIYLYPYGSM